MNYSSSMPIDWKGTDHTPQGSIKVGSSTITPSNWYHWNTPPDGKTFENSDSLLVWREGSTSGRIVHHVDKDNMKLYATYVDKRISDSRDNDEVIRLMQNPGYNGNPHKVTVDRKLQAGMYNTICLPFPVNLNSLPAGHPLKDADVRKLNGMHETFDEAGESLIILNFEQVTTMEAGEPYIIKLRQGLGNVTTPMEFTGVTYNSLTTNANDVRYVNNTNFSSITFHAVTKPTVVPEGSYILVAENRLAKATGGEMKGLRGYFVIDDPYLAAAAKDGRVYLSVSKPTTTSIPVAPEAEQQTKPEVRKIMRDGKIYILRGEEIYTITGHRVK